MKKDNENVCENSNNEKKSSVKAEKSEEKLSALKKAAADAKKEAETAKKSADEAIEKEKEATERMLRIAAEYDNFRKRAVKEKEDAYTDAYIDAVKILLPVMDNLERAKSFEKDSDSTGFSLIMKQIEDCFQKLGIEEIPALDLPFDPNYHNAVMIDADNQKEPNTVTEVLQKGYTVRGKVIRFAMVKVAN